MILNTHRPSQVLRTATAYWPTTGCRNRFRCLPRRWLPLSNALQIDSTLVEVILPERFTRTFLNFDWQGAEEDYKRAIELNPNYVAAHTWYGLMLLMPQGRWAEAAAELAYRRASGPRLTRHYR